MSFNAIRENKILAKISHLLNFFYTDGGIIDEIRSLCCLSS